MVRAIVVAALLLMVGCALPPDRGALRPLPEEGPPLPYNEIVFRSRLQAAAAVEAFYVNRWDELEDAARALEQSARFLGKAAEVPPRHKDTLTVEAGDLGKDAAALREAVKAQDVKRTNEILQRLNLKVRELRAD